VMWLAGGRVCHAIAVSRRKQAMAMHTAVSRVQFELNCPEATGTILSRESVQVRVDS